MHRIPKVGGISKEPEPSPRTKACISDIIRQELLGRLGRSPFVPKADVENYVEKRLREIMLVEKYAAGDDTSCSEFTTTDSDEFAEAREAFAAMSVTERNKQAPLETTDGGHKVQPKLRISITYDDNQTTSSEFITTTTSESIDLPYKTPGTYSREGTPSLISLQLKEKMQKYLQKRSNEDPNSITENKELAKSKALTHIPFPSQPDNMTGADEANSVVVLHLNRNLPGRKLSREMKTYITNLVQEELNIALAKVNFVDHFAKEKDFKGVIEECLQNQRAAHGDNRSKVAPTTTTAEATMAGASHAGRTANNGTAYEILNNGINKLEKKLRAVKKTRAEPKRIRFAGGKCEETQGPVRDEEVTKPNQPYKTVTRRIVHQGKYVYATKRVSPDRKNVNIYYPMSGALLH